MMSRRSIKNPADMPTVRSCGIQNEHAGLDKLFQLEKMEVSDDIHVVQCETRQSRDCTDGSWLRRYFSGSVEIFEIQMHFYDFGLTSNSASSARENRKRKETTCGLHCCRMQAAWSVFEREPHTNRSHFKTTLCMSISRKRWCLNLMKISC